MLKIKVSEATPLQLDWLVAKCLGFVKISVWPTEICVCKKHSFEDSVVWHPTKDWAQGGPIIEREHVFIVAPYKSARHWVAYKMELDTPLPCWREEGPNPLVAAMRCYAASKLGEEVEVPEELT